jgi:hypothetical protein
VLDINGDHTSCVTNTPMNPALRDKILDEFQKLRNLMEQIPTNEDRKKMRW